jgi:hypothetical protein
MAQDLSLGGMVLAADALAAAAGGLAAPSQGRWERARGQWQDDASRRGGAIERKATAEFSHRLNLWRAYLQDLEEKPHEAAAYAVEVRHRVILNRLLPILRDEVGVEAKRLEQADEQLRLRFHPGGFVWPPDLEQTYPQVSFWYLYGKPSETN